MKYDRNHLCPIYMHGQEQRNPTKISFRKHGNIFLRYKKNEIYLEKFRALQVNRTKKIENTLDLRQGKPMSYGNKM